MLLLLYVQPRGVFIGFIPNDQQAFIDRLRKVIKQQKDAHAFQKNSVVARVNPFSNKLYQRRIKTSSYYYKISASRSRCADRCIFLPVSYSIKCSAESAQHTIIRFFGVRRRTAKTGQCRRICNDGPAAYANGL